MTYKIIRFYQKNEELNGTIVTTGLTKEQAQAHCNNPETASNTATNPEAVARTEQYGPWFDGWTKETR
jgi:hypothetical protein